jgi:hypothetical protein
MDLTVVVVGSADPERTYNPSLRDTEGALRAAERLGHELAKRGCSIVVHSGDTAFIEGAVVRGYVESGLAQPRSVQVRPRYGRVEDIGFPELAQHREVFDTMPEVTADWEVTYYRSLLAADGVLAIGGGRATFVAGLLALSQRIALLAVAGFGGAAEKVWQRFTKEPNWASEEELARMAEPWHDGLATELVDALINQHRRLEAHRAQVHDDVRHAARELTVGLVFGAVLLLCALASIPLSYRLPADNAGSIALLVGAPLVAATCGAVVRGALDGRSDWLRTAVLGAAAGAMTFLLFVAAQLAAVPNLLREGDAVSRLLYFVIPLAFVAGLTFDAVYHKLRAQDVAPTAALQPPGK